MLIYFGVKSPGTDDVGFFIAFSRGVTFFCLDTKESNQRKNQENGTREQLLLLAAARLTVVRHRLFVAKFKGLRRPALYGLRPYEKFRNPAGFLCPAGKEPVARLKRIFVFLNL